MSIQVKFFASLREKVGMSDITIDTATTAADAWNIATEQADIPTNLLVAINLEYAQLDSPIHEGDEVAFSHPLRVANMTVHIAESAFDPWQEIIKQQHYSALANQYGATATFVGTMRDFNDNADVSAMTLEHYPAMTQHYMEKLEQQARQRWDLLDLLLIHRVGQIIPADPIVLIACWSSHRHASLEACAWLIEELKHKAPFWKKETRQEGDRWVESNTDSINSNN